MKAREFWLNEVTGGFHTDEDLAYKGYSLHVREVLPSEVHSTQSTVYHAIDWTKIWFEFNEGVMLPMNEIHQNRIQDLVEKALKGEL